jgi:5-oxoprolinase (ATP-hydrolysing) subunit C
MTGPRSLRPLTPSASSRSATDMLRVREPGALSTVQDGGRPMAAHLGVPLSGACDTWSMASANRLLGNDEGAAVLEMTLLGATLEVTASGVIAIAGADMEAVEEGHARPLAPGRSHEVRAGEVLRFGAAVRGVRTYLALPGGIDVEPILGSRSTCLAGGFGGLDGRPLAPGDVLRASRPPTGAKPDRRWATGGFDPTVGSTIRVVRVSPAPGVHATAFDRLLGQTWTVSPVGDRTGVRLKGDPVPVTDAAERLVSTGVLPGAIQLPASGQPIVLLADAPTIGGYPVLAVVARADLPIVAQRQPGDEVRFVAITSQEARTAARLRRREGSESPR